MQYLILCMLITSVASTVRKFPKNFTFGASSSAYQYEGAWNEDGKGASIWDTAAHRNPSRIIDGSTGDIAADTYHLYKEDVKLMSYLGLDSFRFSFSWSRILPTGFANKINQAGIDYYHNFIDELIKYNITPHATIYHWDLPEKLQELGGWTNPLIGEWFEDYAKVLYENFGDKVKMWATINEPAVSVCFMGYSASIVAPFVRSNGVGEYLCIKNALVAHARAYHLYYRNYNEDKKGQVGIILNTGWYIPLTHNDGEAAADAFQFIIGIIAHPILSESGDFPEAVKRIIDAKSSEQGFPRSRLPKLTKQEIDNIKGSADYIGVNYYMSSFVYRNALVQNMYSVPSSLNDMGVGIVRTRLIDTLIDPTNLYNLLLKIKEQYNNPVVYITESGWYSGGGLADGARARYLAGHVHAARAAADAGCDVRGYSVWSLLDNFEWTLGYTNRYGLFEVDFSSPNRTRTPRESALFYKNMIASRSVSYERKSKSGKTHKIFDHTPFNSWSFLKPRAAFGRQSDF